MSDVKKAEVMKHIAFQANLRLCEEGVARAAAEGKYAFDPYITDWPEDTIQSIKFIFEDKGYKVKLSQPPGIVAHVMDISWKDLK